MIATGLWFSRIWIEPVAIAYVAYFQRTSLDEFSVTVGEVVINDRGDTLVEQAETCALRYIPLRLPQEYFSFSIASRNALRFCRLVSASRKHLVHHHMLLM